MEEFKLKTIKDTNGIVYNIDSILGQGGQGMVCKTKDSHIAIKFVMKNDEPYTDEAFYDKYKDRIDDVIIMNIDNDVNICKPIMMLEKPYCGYVMHLLSDLKPINNLIFDINTDSNFNDFFKNTDGLKKRLEVLIELARTLARLHSKGIIYCDISPNNVFYSDTSNFSKVWIIDCDNLKYTTDVRNGIYTPGYGAPEVVSNASSNTIFSDCYSFAVLAFKVLTQRNPFEISYTEESSSDDWDATTTDKKDSNNVNIPWLFENGITDELKNYFNHFINKDLLDLFNRTFNEQGRLDPSSRPSMREWYEKLKSAYLNINKCGCGTYILSGEKECPFCNAKRSYRFRGSLLNLYPDVDEIKNQVKEELTKEDFDDLKYINDMMDNKLNIKTERITSDFIIYDNDIIYNFNINDISIYENPYPLFKFEYRNGYLYVFNKTTLNIPYIFKGERNKLLSNDNKSFAFEPRDLLQLFYIDPDTKIRRCILVRSV